MAEDDFYTKDGTVNYQGNPANKKKTGTWKACIFIIGNCKINLFNLVMGNQRRMLISLALSNR